MKTLKIVGVPGVGKSTLIRNLIKRNHWLKSICYGELLLRLSGLPHKKLYSARPRDYRLTDIYFKEEFKKYKKRYSLILVDDNLEIEQENWSLKVY